MVVRVSKTDLDGVLVLEPTVYGDDRGFFQESWNRSTFHDVVGLDADFVQDNHSRSARDVVRGIHYQLPNPMAKLVRCTFGRVFDVAVDLRRSSPAFGRWVGFELSDENHRQLWIPEGFGHGFAALSDRADLQYKTTAYFDQAADRAIAWNDPDLGVEWPIQGAPVVSDRDMRAPKFRDADVFD